MELFRKIMVPVDFAPSSRAALERALELAAALGSSVSVLHVEPADEKGEKTVTPAESHDARIRELGEYVEHARSVLGDRVQDRLCAGDPQWVIREQAAEDGCDLIVMGTHGRVGRLHLLTGSVAESVIRNAPCPVMVVRAPS